MLGRRRLYDLGSYGPEAVARQAGNCVIQSSSASIMKAALVEAYKAGLDVRLTIHDEMICYVEADRAEQEAVLLEQCMLRGAQRVVQMGVKRGLDLQADIPFEAKATVCRNWSEK